MAAPPILATLSFGLLLLLLSAPPVRAAPLSRVLDVVYPSSLPPPWQDTSAICTPFSPPASADPTAALCDPSAFLSSTQILALSDTLARVFAGVSPYSLVSCPDVSPAAGFRVAVAAVRSMPYDENSVATRAQIYADTLFTQWGLADNCGASVLLFLAVDDRRLYIKTGVLAADYVSNSMINLIFSAMASPLTVGDINGALVTAVTMITAELSKYDPDTADDVPPADTSSDDQDAGSPFDPIFFKNGPEWWDLELSLVALVSFAALVLACCNGVGGPDQARKKKQIRELLEKLDVVRTEYIRAALPGYEPDSCPISQQPLNPNPAVLPTTPISSAEDSLLADDSSESERQTVRFPCGHVYIKSWLDNFPREREDVCPVSGISSSDPNPPSLADTRVNDLAFRLNRLKEEYPQLITPAVFSKLSTVNPSTWPDRLEPSFLTVSNTSSRSYSAIGGGSVGGSGTGNLLTGLGLGALGGFLFGNAVSGGGGSDQTATSDAAGWVGQQDVSGLGGGGGGGAAFGDGGGGLGGGFSGISGAISQATNTFGGGWGFGGSQDGGGGGGGGGF